MKALEGNPEAQRALEKTGTLSCPQFTQDQIYHISCFQQIILHMCKTNL